ncbi:MAG: RDD family protein [Flavobacteriales bacterium]|nr:RDD family protein [Flavobacteriales bacterium]
MDNQLSVNTTQNVHISYEVANIGDRFMAYLIDALILGGFMLAMGFVAGLITAASGSMLWMILIYLPMLFYHLVCELTMNGQSIGKRQYKLRVIKQDGTSASFGNYFIRFLLRPIDSLFGIGLLVILINGKGQRLGDIAAGTTLVKLERKKHASDFYQVDVPEGYTPVYAETADLTDAQINFIREILHKRRNDIRHQTVIQLADKMKSLMKVESDQIPFQFLRTILRDHQYYHGGGAPEKSSVEIPTDPGQAKT